MIKSTFHKRKTQQIICHQIKTFCNPRDISKEVRRHARDWKKIFTS